MDSLILHNNRIIPLSEVRLSPGQAGLLAGWGVFTTLRVYRGQPFEFHRHWERMARDAARLGLEMIWSESDVASQIVELAGANRRPEGMARVWFVRNQGGLWADNVPRPATDLLVFTRELAPWPAVHRLLLVPHAIYSVGVLAGAKMLSWAQNTLLAERARAEGCDDALLLNERDELAECTSANVFLVRDGRALTPPLSSGCLPGVTREVLLEIAPEAGIEIEERTLRPEDLERADEVFISSTTREVAGVGFVGSGRGDPLKWAAPGKVTEALEAAFQRYVHKKLGPPAAG
ncbi:MAG TPA: aminotransferase class IV [Terriglobia bacterium]|jgi:branched-chain amino acid aminotransferase|nr:aminotransferase class IV [Terriglobia bacterium]